jgi:hypothetical protein
VVLQHDQLRHAAVVAQVVLGPLANLPSGRPGSAYGT